MFGKKKEMSPSEKKAKLAALGEANSMATGMMKDGIKGLKKVTVASDSKEGLKEGLDKAEDILGNGEKKSPFDNSESDSEDSEEYDEASDDVLAQCDSEQEIDDLISKLMEKKKQLQS